LVLLRRFNLDLSLPTSAGIAGVGRRVFLLPVFAAAGAPRAARRSPASRSLANNLANNLSDDARSRSNRGEITTRVRPLTSSVAADQEERHWQVNGGRHFENVAVVACYRRKQNPPVGSGAEDFTTCAEKRCGARPDRDRYNFSKNDNVEILVDQ
jgi:hypothetical protein